jgi:hypothetical protein
MRRLPATAYEHCAKLQSKVAHPTRFAGQVRADFDRTLRIGRLQTLERYGLAREGEPGAGAGHARTGRPHRPRHRWRGRARPSCRDRGDLTSPRRRASAASSRLPKTRSASGRPGHCGAVEWPWRVSAVLPSQADQLIDFGDVHLPRGADADAFVDSHVRRLKALRRAGIVECLGDDRWRRHIAINRRLCAEARAARPAPLKPPARSATWRHASARRLMPLSIRACMTQWPKAAATSMSGRGVYANIA